MKRGVFLSIIVLGIVCGAGSALAQTNALRSAGTDFWTAFPTNDPNNPDFANLTVYVTAESTSVVTTTLTEKTVQKRRIPDTSPQGFHWGYTPAYDTVVTR